MDMNAFFGITLSLIVLRIWWKHRPLDGEKKKQNKPSSGGVIPVNYIEKEGTKAERERQKEAEDLRKQGYTDEVIAVILPTINGGSN